MAIVYSQLTIGQLPLTMDDGSQTMDHQPWAIAQQTLTSHE